jgi:hypothetical protein
MKIYFLLCFIYSKQANLFSWSHGPLPFDICEAKGQIFFLRSHGPFQLEIFQAKV